MKSYIKQNPLLSYFVLAYALSWIFWIAVILLNLTENDVGLLLFLLGVYGASGAGFIMTAIMDGRPGVRKLWARLLKWRVGFIWYLGVFIAVPAMILAGMALYALLGNSTGPFVPGPLPMLLLGAIPGIIFGPLGEEFGWRGFALPRLQERYSAFWSSVILGILHTFWHAPLFFVGGITFGTIGENGLVTIPLFLSWVTIGTFVYTVVSNHTGASLLLAIFLHLMANSSNTIVFGMFPELSESAQFQIMALTQIPGWITVVVLLVVFGPARLSRQPIPQPPEIERHTTSPAS
jgi:membrane protease YdiL (CAAX protease family)